MARGREKQGNWTEGVFTGVLVGGAALTALYFAPPIHGVKPGPIFDILSPMGESAASRERHDQAITLSGKVIELYKADGKGVDTRKMKHGDTQEYYVVKKIKHEDDKGATRYIASTSVDAETKSPEQVVNVSWEVQECKSSKDLSCRTVRQTRIYDETPVNFWVTIGLKQPFSNWTEASDIPEGQFATFDDFSDMIGKNG